MGEAKGRKGEVTVRKLERNGLGVGEAKRGKQESKGLRRGRGRGKRSKGGRWGREVKRRMRERRRQEEGKHERMGESQRYKRWEAREKVVGSGVFPKSLPPQKKENKNKNRNWRIWAKCCNIANIILCNRKKNKEVEATNDWGGNLE